ncbi:RNA-binding protein [Philodulcilactobacillus myokoensis]|uniref:RNA-binding protein n=1 Tax=Philodulcilactobacillus myokoensis TaxID=2929573 RepID=A0A9W6ETP5_9LACO|nr:ASCH domain-containing protein [Philodulcilactobacillus myokoensis]GLB47527.1 RNA-binding protein [Philodulcilactobacillus myokoensis]
MTPEKFFKDAKQALNLPSNTKLTSTYAFGVDADYLAQLVLNGIKTATTSAYDLYEKDEHLPIQGEYDVVTDDHGNPVCVTYTEKVNICTYNQVPAKHAYLEGEGDRTMKYWRKVHNDFFTNEYHRMGKTFNPEISKMVLENFYVVYPIK